MTTYISSNSRRVGRLRGRRRHSVSRERVAGWLLAGPALLHLSLWVGLPLVVALILSFTRYDIPAAPSFIGFDNYIEAFSNANYRRAVLNTFILTGVAVPVSLAIALGLAVLLNIGLRWQGFFRAAIFMPHITATVAIAVVWLWIYSSDGAGLLNRIIGIFSFGPVAWLGRADLALWSVIVMYIWQSIGIKMLIYVAALQGLPVEVDEAARIDGANAIQRFLRITVPLLRPATFFVLIISVIASFQVFDQIYILTDGGPANATTVVTYQIYQSAFKASRMGYASAQSIILFIFLIGMSFLSRRIVGGTDAH